ncbi:lipid-A-disaccharide synthase [Pseudodesulfovibrio sp. F-1]|uniref:Lipid-A-disaccharide synthase n=1 Tax=Pseudodesulfovibrio alkaliphilus TaxID=2661613 RepID=A0A7K1KJK7_9BACT|nr:lipid-A-disaccharide synthase [Pseudodesulfovibrio alkaliphilus]MUM76273.1 lipid-A-disaccharide synthase [Pseudodesulfovibrio alkaliphilus]
MLKENAHAPIWFNVGEASGDLHGAELMKQLREREPCLRFTGMGGPAMGALGFETRYDMGLISLVGITEILGGLPRILLLLRRIRLAFMAVRPRAVVLIDCPEFNFRVARMARELGIPVYYYISPQLWAWRPKRVEFLREHVRRVVCILPFEKDFYARHAMDVEYVGHPLMDVLPLERLDAMAVDENLVGLLPGSRTREVSTLLPEFAKAARLLREKRPGLRFVIVRAPGMDAERLRSLWGSDIEVEIVGPEARYETFRVCSMMLAASGTVTLETALIGTPVVVAYRVSALSALMGRMLIRVPHISLPNLIAGREVYPELVQERATARQLAAAATVWLDSPDALASVRRDLAGLRSMVGEPGAAARAAAIILDDLASLD